MKNLIQVADVSVAETMETFNAVMAEPAVTNDI